jgi:CRP-like cAMP-binding protein
MGMVEFTWERQMLAQFCALKSASESCVAHRPIPFLNERTSSTGKPVKNKILTAIPDNEFRSLRPHLESVELADHVVLHEPHQPLSFVHFLNEGLVSLVVVLSDGKTVEAGIVGNEGVVGIPALAGLSRSPIQEITQISGNAVRVPANSIQDVLSSAPQLHRKLELYSVILGLQLAQTAACNRLHGVEQRLARWLLMAQDRVESPVLPITHDFLSTMLGTDRPSVSLAAGVLQKNGLIEYNRGSVRILNREELRRVACECYSVIQQYNSEL